MSRREVGAAHASVSTSGSSARPRRTAGGPAGRRPQRPVGRVAEADQVGGEVALGEAEHPPGLLLVRRRRSGRCRCRGRPPPSSCSRSPGRRRTGGVAAAARPPARRHDGDRRRGPGDVPRRPARPWPARRSCARSVTTTKSHGCQLLADGARRPASRMRSRSSRGDRLVGVGARCGVPGWRPTSPCRRSTPLRGDRGPRDGARGSDLLGVLPRLVVGRRRVSGEPGA